MGVSCFSNRTPQSGFGFPLGFLLELDKKGYPQEKTPTANCSGLQALKAKLRPPTTRSHQNKQAADSDPANTGVNQRHARRAHRNTHRPETQLKPTPTAQSKTLIHAMCPAKTQLKPTPTAQTPVKNPAEIDSEERGKPKPRHHQTGRPLFALQVSREGRDVGTVTFVDQAGSEVFG